MGFDLTRRALHSAARRVIGSTCAPYSGFNRIQRAAETPPVRDCFRNSTAVHHHAHGVRRASLRNSTQGLTWPELPWLSQKATQATMPTPTAINAPAAQLLLSPL